MPDPIHPELPADWHQHLTLYDGYTNDEALALLEGGRIPLSENPETRRLQALGFRQGVALSDHIGRYVQIEAPRSSWDVDKTLLGQLFSRRWLKLLAGLPNFIIDRHWLATTATAYQIPFPLSQEILRGLSIGRKVNGVAPQAKPIILVTRGMAKDIATRFLDYPAWALTCGMDMDPEHPPQLEALTQKILAAKNLLVGEHIDLALQRSFSTLIHAPERFTPAMHALVASAAELTHMRSWNSDRFVKIPEIAEVLGKAEVARGLRAAHFDDSSAIKAGVEAHGGRVHVVPKVQSQIDGKGLSEPERVKRFQAISGRTGMFPLAIEAYMRGLAGKAPLALPETGLIPGWDPALAARQCKPLVPKMSSEAFIELLYRSYVAPAHRSRDFILNRDCRDMSRSSQAFLPRWLRSYTGWSYINPVRPKLAAGAYGFLESGAMELSGALYSRYRAGEPLNVLDTCRSAAVSSLLGTALYAGTMAVLGRHWFGTLFAFTAPYVIQGLCGQEIRWRDVLWDAAGYALLQGLGRTAVVLPLRRYAFLKEAEIAARGSTRRVAARAFGGITVQTMMVKDAILFDPSSTLRWWFWRRAAGPLATALTGMGIASGFGVFKES